MSLDLTELQAVAEQFGLSDEQVHRDHVVSHLLALTSGELADEILFIGGTALVRTHLLDGRLSEDLDFIALARRSEVAAALHKLLPRGASRAIGALRWNPSLAPIRDADAANSVVADAVALVSDISPDTIEVDIIPKLPPHPSASPNC